MVSDVKYCSAAEIRAAMDMNNKDDDAMLNVIAEAVSRMIDGHLGYQHDGFLASATASIREYAGSGTRWMWIDPCIEITGIRMKNSISDADFDIDLLTTDYRGFRGDPSTPGTVRFNALPYHGLMMTSSSSHGRWLYGAFADSARYFYNDRDADLSFNFEPTVEITGKWGYAATVPAPIKQAAIMQSERVYKRQQGGMADALLSPEMGMSRFLSELDKDVKVFLNHSRLKRPRLGVGR